MTKIILSQYLVMKPTISVFFPCYNDYKSIGTLIKDSLLILKKVASKFEVIVIDDFSTDGSRQLLKKLQGQYKNLTVYFHSKNLGYGGALRSGFRAAKYDLVFYTDGDGQYDPKELPIMVSLMTEDVSFINGIKLSRQDPTYRLVVGNVYSFITRWFFWLPIVDVDCDFRLIRKSLVKKLDLKSSSGAICIELVKKAQRQGGKFRQVTIHHLERKHGQSQFFRPERILLTLCELSSLWFKLMIIDKFFKK